MIGKTISHYKILEKIGEGGMGAVYKARDTKLGRVVALKFLTSHALGDKGERARFIHEAKAGAAINHPNICSVYEIGEHEGRAFIAMEYVEGDSLRTKMIEGPLELTQALEIAIQVADGLREAHENGVVHRDVKPSNIVISVKGRAKIMDFGVAKLRDVSRVTKTGSTIGTACYMSPEQAKGLDVDQRSDIFSLGSVLYEMLTGRLPFAEEHELAVMYSIVNLDPKPVRELREDIPEELEKILKRALEKDIEKRYQGMDELLGDLRQVRDNLAGRAKKSGVGAEVAGATASTGAGAPAAESGVPGRSDSAATDPSREGRGGVRRWIAYGVIGTAVIAVALFVGIKIQIGKQTPAEAAESRLAIMYFENLADREDSGRLGEMIASLLIADLSESAHIQVVSSQRLHDVLQLLGVQDKKAIDEDTAGEVARRVKAKWMLTGRIMRAEPRLTVVGELVEVASGNTIASQRIAAEEGEDVFAVVDRFSDELKKDLSLPEPGSAGASRKVADITTHSREAYRHYLEGLELQEKFYSREAYQSFLKAVEADSTFAMAYYHLAKLSSGALSRGYMEKAVKYSANAVEKDRRYIEALQAVWNGEGEKYLEILERIVKDYPDEKDAHYSLGGYYRSRAELEKAVSHFQRVVEIDPMDKLAYNSLAYTYDRQGDLENALIAINKYVELAPDEPNPYDTRGEIYANNGMLDDAIESYKKAVEIKPDYYSSVRKLGTLYVFKRDYESAERVLRMLFKSDDAGQRSMGRVLLSDIPTFRGRYHEASEVLQEGIDADRLEGYEGHWYFEKLLFRMQMPFNREDMIGTLNAYYDYIGELRKLYPNSSGGGQDMYVYALRAMGSDAKADSVMGLIRAEANKDSSWMYSFWSVSAMGELGRGNPGKAYDYCLKSVEAKGLPEPSSYDLALLGVTAQEAGKLGEAVEHLESFLSKYDENRQRLVALSPIVRYHLARAYEESGWKEKAIAEYEEVMDIWKDADPDVPRVIDARARLARLKRES